MAHIYQTTFQDFKDAQRLHRSHRTSARVSFWVWIVAFPIVAGVLCLVTLAMLVTGRVQAATVLIPVSSWFGFMAMFMAILRPIQYRKLFRRCVPDGMKDILPTEFSFGEEGVRSGIIGRSEGRFLWGAIVDYAEDERLALLYIKKKLFIYLPKRAMPEDEWQQLRMYVREKTG